MANCIAIIPARGGSKGIPDKNIKSLNGHPLLAYSIQAALKSSLIDRVIVSTDSEEYLKIAKHYGAEAPFLRPEALSKDSSTDLEFVTHFFEWMTANNQPLPDYLIHLRPTTPLREASVLDAAITNFKKLKDQATSLRSAHVMSETAYKTFECEDNYLLPLGKKLSPKASNQPRQQLPDTYQANGYIDILKPEYIINNNELHGDKIAAHITKPVCEIDTPEDFNYIEYQITQQLSIFTHLFG